MKILLTLAISALCLVVGFLLGSAWAAKTTFSAMGTLQEVDFSIQFEHAREAYNEPPSTAIWAFNNALKTLEFMRPQGIFSDKQYLAQEYLIYSRILFFEKKDNRDTSATMAAISEVMRKLEMKPATEAEIIDSLMKRDDQLRELQP